MNYIKKKIVLFISIFSIVIIGICSSQKDTYAKDYTGKLEEGRTYKSNLDKKGKQEKICVKYEGNSLEWSVIYINSKKVFKTKDDINVYILDVNKKDKQMEIFIVKGDYRISVQYYKYKSSKLKKMQDFGSLVRKKYNSLNHLEVLSENAKTGSKKILSSDLKGKVCLRGCIKLKNNLGSVGIKEILTLKGEKFVVSKKKNFKIEKSYLGNDIVSEEGLYRMVGQDKIILISEGSNKVYKKIGSKKIAFKLKNKEKFYRQEIYIKDKKTYYIKIKTKKGKVGYVKNGQTKAEVFSINESKNTRDYDMGQECLLH